jgi:hypothetical protein
LSENKHLTVCFDEQGTVNLMPPLFGKNTHIHPTDFSLTVGRGTTTFYACAGLNLECVCRFGISIAFL